MNAASKSKPHSTECVVYCNVFYFTEFNSTGPGYIYWETSHLKSIISSDITDNLLSHPWFSPVSLLLLNLVEEFWEGSVGSSYYKLKDWPWDVDDHNRHINITTPFQFCMNCLLYLTVFKILCISNQFR